MARDRHTPRQPAVSAELGRPETPEETAARKADASRRRRANQTTFNLVIALIASLGIVLFLVLVVVRPAPPPPEPVDYRAAAAEAQPAVEAPLLAPAAPEGWYANRAEFEAGGSDEVASWSIGFITAESEYIELVQGVDATAGWISALVGDAAASTGSVAIEGQDWIAYDRRSDPDVGNRAYALVSTVAESTYVLAGTAGDEEFRELAEAVAVELEEGE